MASYYSPSTELYHYGVKGMKWGVRKKRDAYNKSYTTRQRKNDRAVYGRRAEKRINRRLNEGYGIQGARALEKRTQRERREKRERTARKVKNAASSVVSAYLTDQIFFGGRGTRLTINLGKSLVKDAVYLSSLAYNAIPRKF